VRQLPILLITVALGAGAQACSRGERSHGGPEATANATTPPEGVTSASAERQIITLTGCLKRDVQPGTYALMSVATAGVLDDDSAPQQQRRQDTQGQRGQVQEGQAATGTDTSTAGSAATLAAGSSYRLIADDAEHREEMAKHENKRVVVRGRLAAEGPVGTTGNAGGAAGTGTKGGATAGGTVTDSSPTNATVAGSAPPLRGFHVESVKKVGESCSAE
jgi:hypothetical protein